MTVDKSDTETERKKTDNKKPRATEQAVTEQNDTTDYIGTDPMWEFVYAYLNLLKHIGAKYDKGFCRRYKQLTDYVFQKKIKLPDCNVLNEYHVYEIAPK